MIEEWDIKPCSGVCGACRTPFRDRQAFMAKLTLKDDRYERTDFCETCWEKPNTHDPVPFSTWKGLFKPPLQEVLKKETAESLLRKLMADGDESKKNLVYVLAVMLERKRILAEKDSQEREDGTRIIVFEHKKTCEVFLVPEPRLRLDQLGEVQAEVTALLEGSGGDSTSGEQAAAEADLSRRLVRRSLGEGGSNGQTGAKTDVSRRSPAKTDDNAQPQDRERDGA